MESNLSALRDIASSTGPMGVILGFVDRNTHPEGREYFNAAALMAEGAILGVIHKTPLPTYDVFDEERYFERSRETRVLAFRGRNLGISICEDAWNAEDFWSRPLYPIDPIRALVGQGADLLVNISASPFEMDKPRFRHGMLLDHVRRHGLPVVYLNLVGGNDDLIFDGNSGQLPNRLHVRGHRARSGARRLARHGGRGCQGRHRFQWQEFPWSCDWYKAHGKMCPDDAPQILRQFDAIYFGAVGNPAIVADHISAWGLLINFRRWFDLYVNLRPVRLFEGLPCPLAGRKPGDIDYYVIRENTEGEYGNVGGRMFEGTEREVVPEGLRVMEAAAAKDGLRFQWQEFPWSCDWYKAHGKMFRQRFRTERCSRVRYSM